MFEKTENLPKKIAKKYKQNLAFIWNSEKK